MTVPATAEPETPAEKPALIRQPRGGALYAGGVKGNKAKKHHPDRIRRIARSLLVDRVELLGHIADGVAVQFTEGGKTELISPKPHERVRAIAELAKIGLGAPVTIADIRERMHQQIEVIRATLPADVANELLKKLADVWR